MNTPRKRTLSHGVMVFEHSEMVRTYDTRFWDGLKIMNLVFDGLILRWLMRHDLVTLIKTIFRLDVRMNKDLSAGDTVVSSPYRTQCEALRVSKVINIDNKQQRT